MKSTCCRRGIEVDVRESQIVIADGHRPSRGAGSAPAAARRCAARDSRAWRCVGAPGARVAQRCRRSRRHCGCLSMPTPSPTSVGIEVRAAGTWSRITAWRCPRLRRNQIRDHHAFHRLEQRLEGVVGGIEDERAVQRWRRLHGADPPGAAACRARCARRDRLSSRRHCDQLTRMRLLPSHNGKCRAEASAERGTFDGRDLIRAWRASARVPSCRHWSRAAACSRHRCACRSSPGRHRNPCR